jgi:aconitase B
MAKNVTYIQKGITPEQLKRTLHDASLQRDKAAEATAEQASIMRAAIEQHGLDKTALTFSRRLETFEASKRNATIRAALEYWAKLGYFDQRDAFDDMLEMIQQWIGGSAEGGELNRRLVS